MPNHQVLRSVMPGSVGATRDRSPGGFKLHQMAGLGGMVPRGLGGDRTCVLMDVRRAVDGVYGGPGKVITLISPEDESVEDGGYSCLSLRIGAR